MDIDEYIFAYICIDISQKTTIYFYLEKHITFKLINKLSYMIFFFKVLVLHSVL